VYDQVAPGRLEERAIRPADRVDPDDPPALVERQHRFFFAEDLRSGVRWLQLRRRGEQPRVVVDGSDDGLRDEGRDRGASTRDELLRDA
jgi:hypothetical protein